MKCIITLVILLAMLLTPASVAFSQATPTPKGKTSDSTKSDGKTDAPKAPKPVGDYAAGYVETLERGATTFVTVRYVDASDSVRRLKVEGKIKIALTPEGMRNVALLRQGELVVLTGVIKDGTFFASMVAVATKKK